MTKVVFQTGKFVLLKLVGLKQEEKSCSSHIIYLTERVSAL